MRGWTHRVQRDILLHRPDSADQAALVKAIKINLEAKTVSFERDMARTSRMMERNPIPSRVHLGKRYTAANPGSCTACGMRTVLTRKGRHTCEACGESQSIVPQPVADYLRRRTDSTGPR